MPKKKTIEEIAFLTVANGSNTATVRVTPPAGFVARVVAHFGEKNNTGFVRAYLKDAVGVEIVKMQSIDSLRSRNVEFENDGKAINIETRGRTFEFGVLASENFTADFNAELTFIYEQEDTNGKIC